MPGAQPVLVRAARAGGNAVDVAADVLVGRLGPLQHEIEPRTAFALEHERGARAPAWPRVRRRSSDEVGQPFLVLEDLLRPLRLVLERDADTLVDVADDLEPLANHARIELDLRENRRIGVEVDRRARSRAPRQPSSAGRSACRA